MKYINMPVCLSGRTCGIAIFSDDKQCLQPIEKIQIIRFAAEAAQQGFAKGHSTFLVALSNERNIYLARVLLHFRTNNRRLRIVVVAPNDEAAFCTSLSSRVVVSNVVTAADDTLPCDVPFSDYPIQLALYSDHLIVSAMGDTDTLDAFLEDMTHIQCLCSIEKMQK